MFLFRAVAAAIFVICIPVVIFATGVRVLAQDQRIYTYSIEQYKADVKSGIAEGELIRGATELRRYLNGDSDSVNIRVNKAGNDFALFNTKELAHLADVKSLVLWTYRLQEAAIMFAVAYVIAVYVWAREGSIRSLMKQALAGALITLGIIIGCGAFAVTGFDSFFEEMHVLLFNNDFWKMDPETDHLIQMFPQKFWIDATVFYTTISLALGLFVALVCSVHLGLTRVSMLPLAQTHPPIEEPG